MMRALEEAKTVSGLATVESRHAHLQSASTKNIDHLYLFRRIGVTQRKAAVATGMKL
jgi:hypothetical protein